MHFAKQVKTVCGCVLLTQNFFVMCAGGRVMIGCCQGRAESLCVCMCIGFEYLCKHIYVEHKLKTIDLYIGEEGRFVFCQISPSNEAKLFESPSSDVTETD